MTRPDWLATLRRYILALAIGNLVWEIVQLPLYVVWRSGTVGELAFDVLHCTAGDVLIASTTLLISLLLIGASDWPHARFGWSAAIALPLGVGYAVYSEYLNTTIRGTWAYSAAMPTLPWLGTGLTPLAQWLIVPPIALVWAVKPSVTRGIRRQLRLRATQP